MGKLLPTARIRDENGIVSKPKTSILARHRYRSNFDDWCIREEVRLKAFGLTNPMNHIPMKLKRGFKYRRSSLRRV